MGILRQYGVEYYGPIIGGISGKREIQKNRQKILNEFYEEIIKTINNFEGIEGIVIGGPGFWKNDFYQYLNDNYSEKSKISSFRKYRGGWKGWDSRNFPEGCI